jgi:hypothetical protein
MIFALAAIPRLHTIAPVNHPMKTNPALPPQRQMRALTCFI